MKIKFNSIKIKFLLSFIFIFWFTAIFLNIFISSLLQESYLNKIKRDCDLLYKSSRDYIYQYANLKDITIDETNIVYLAKNIINGIDKFPPEYIRILDKNLNELSEVNKSLDRKYIQFSDDLETAKENKASTTITKINDRQIVSFSYGLYFNENLVAVINFKNDYTYLYEERNSIIFNLNIIMLAMLIFFIAITVYLTNKITKPLYKLMNAVEKITKGSYNTEIAVESNDEVGILASKFNIMQDTIKENMKTIKNLEQHRREFFNNVTHELKTPLTGIKLYADLLEQEYNDAQFVSNAADRIKNESNRLYSLVQNLLDVSKGKITEKTEDFKNLNVKPIAKTIINDMNLMAANKDIKIISEIDDVYIKAYKNHIIQIVINILDNAIKYGLNESNIYINIFEENKFCNIQVKNNITKDNTDSVSGNGIGLFIVDSILNKIDGSLTLKNNSDIFEIKIKIPSL